ncbi:hypothetical protein GQ44DRAFT_733410 [Phaeosphaeriaceae sp. PMI808]|nr:hypothetical protein GQ44DRAFT_733410 [Phaeosphaeriaceae sp. PMI808]
MRATATPLANLSLRIISPTAPAPVQYCASHGGNLTLPASASATTTQGAFSPGAISSGASSSTPAINATPAPKKNSNAGTIAGAVVGGIGGLILILVGIYLVLKKIRRGDTTFTSTDQRAKMVEQAPTSAPVQKFNHETAGDGEQKFTS